MQNGKKMYIMTYDHGGYVLWKENVNSTLREHIGWLEAHPRFKFGLDYEAFTFDEMAKTNPDIMELIRRTLEKYPGRFGLGSTTYGQPLALFISGESPIGKALLGAHVGDVVEASTPGGIVKLKVLEISRR